MTYTDFRNSLKDRKVLVVGMGRSGKAAIDALLRYGAKVYAQDASDPAKIDEALKEHLRNEGVETFFGRIPEDMSAFDMLVLSPGVPTDLPFIREAAGTGAEIIGELELAYRLTPARFVAITGTNGKTTTTTLVGEIFREDGRKTAVVGNIGEPVVTEAVKADEDEWLITEVSSFQLETTREFRPLISAILNLTPDHLNRHKTMEAYGNAKARVAVMQSEDEFLVINGDDPAAMALASQSKAKVIPFSRKTAVLGAGAYLENGGIYVRDTDGEAHYICDTADLRIIGDHNRERSGSGGNVLLCRNSSGDNRQGYKRVPGCRTQDRVLRERRRRRLLQRFQGNECRRVGHCDQGSQKQYPSDRRRRRKVTGLHRAGKAS